MNFEVDRYSSAWARIALCADLTWVAEPPDDFIRANQRLWTQHCRIAQAFQETSENPRSQDRNSTSIRELADKPTSNNNQEDGSCNSRISVKDVIPESRLAQYGNYYYDECRERCYANGYESTSGRGHNGQGSDNNDVTECWMLPEVEYWFQKLMDEQAECSPGPRRRRHFRLTTDDLANKHLTAASGRAAGPAEAALAARVRSVRPLWPPPPGPRAPHPPAPQSRKMRARRRQPRRLSCGPPPLAYCLDAPAPLVCDPSCKFQFDPPRLSDGQRSNQLAIQSLIRNSRTLQTYRGTNVSRYTPTSRPARAPDKRSGVWWPRDHHPPRLDTRNIRVKVAEGRKKDVKAEVKEKEEVEEEKVVEDEQTPSTSAAAIEAGLSKRLYSTVLSAPSPIIINQAALRLSQKLLTPGLLKLNPKIVLPSVRIRPVVENKFEELEKEALEQYKASDESIDTKFRELEKQAVEQYSTSNTSCSSGNSGAKLTSSSATIPEGETKKFPKEDLHFQDVGKAQTTSGTNLKNLKTLPRGEKREQTHRPCKMRLKSEITDSEEGKGPLRWTLHVVPPKKRHLSLCVSDMSSDDEVAKDACMKDHAIRKVKMSAHGGGDLNPLMRKT